MIEVFTAELKEGIYVVNATRTIDGKDYEGVHYISKVMMDWYVDNMLNVSKDFAELKYTSEQLATKYLAWYYLLTEQVSVTIYEKQYELIYTVKNADCLCWLLVDENLNILEPYKLDVKNQHIVKYTAHYNEATKSDKLNF